MLEAQQRRGRYPARGADQPLDDGEPIQRPPAGFGSDVRVVGEVRADRSRPPKRAQEGRSSGGMRPYGYEADGSTVRQDEGSASVLDRSPESARIAARVAWPGPAMSENLRVRIKPPSPTSALVRFSAGGFQVI